MKTCSVLLNHALTDEQITSLEKMGYTPIFPPENLQHLWGNVPAEGGLMAVLDHLAPLLLQIETADAVLAMGELTACIVVSRIAQMRGIPMLVATSRRDSMEVTQADGSVRKTSDFRHVQFREI